jgi:hypothetical protein
MPLGDKIESVGPADGFFDFGFFGSRLPRFCPLAMVRVLCCWFGVVQRIQGPFKSAYVRFLDRAPLRTALQTHNP